MASAARLKGMEETTGSDTVVIEKIRWSLRQRLRKQLHVLSTDCFDEVDDFLFASGQKGQFADDSIYLRAMRELRARQAQFEEQFLDQVIRSIKASYHKDAATPGQAGAAPCFEQVEIDLALQAMRRKAEKLYQPLLGQIDAAQDSKRAALRAQVIDSRVLLAAILDGFAEAQALFGLSLEVRLVFIKLFDQYFVRCLEKVFLDVLSIIRHASNPSFVERLYSSSSAFRKRDALTRQTLHEPPPDASEEEKTQFVSGPGPAATQQAVDELLEALCRQPRMPEFIIRMLRHQWREVMLVTGLNRGIDSLEWSEARNTVNLLCAAIADGIALETRDIENLNEQLQKGFSFIQVEKAVHESFFLELNQYFSQRPGSISVHEVAKRGRTVLRRPQSQEASISPSGQAILDHEDLNEIAKLLGGEENSKEAKVRQLADYLADVDALGGEAAIEFKLQGEYALCRLSVSDADPEQFTISRQGSRLAINRSRLGLALALQSGELRIAGLDRASASGAHTILQVQPSQLRH